MRGLLLGSFNLVIERLLISGEGFDRVMEVNVGFNLVIERLLISGYGNFAGQRQVQRLMFQSRYRAASHFRSVPAELLIRFG